MRYIKKITEYQNEYDAEGNVTGSTETERVIEYRGYQMGNSWMSTQEWIGYEGTLPVSRLDIVDGDVVELPELEPAEEWVDKGAFVNAVTALIPEDQRQTVALQWQTIWGIAQLPGELVNLRDLRIPAFLAGMHLSVDAVREQLSA